MHSPPLELVLDVVHLASRNLIRDIGDPDQDTISEIIRGATDRIRYGDQALALVLAAGGVGFWFHIRRPRWAAIS